MQSWPLLALVDGCSQPIVGNPAVVGPCFSWTSSSHGFKRRVELPEDHLQAPVLAVVDVVLLEVFLVVVTVLVVGNIQSE